ncbi:hypothetical protein DEO72_LG1g2725 [Vigna unguiculata]|uniref:Uncharacterized protein n=1 Tax=Vigna unguiculata TaxID=3917 RepID=A0A4D6KTH3_VIGUN|nr:hypothetical protein DEO72_LG1g2725 [Vigna unguiculata]
MDGLREKFDIIDERLRANQRCKDIEQEWYGNDKVLYTMMEDASNNNFVELLGIFNTTLKCHLRFAEILEFRALRHEIEDMLLKLAIRDDQMSEDLSQLMKDKSMEATSEKLMKAIVEQRDEMIMLRSMNQRMEQLSTDVNEYTIQMLYQPTPESHHIDISTDRYNDAHSNMSTDGHINFTKDVADEEIEDSHTNISTNGYVDDARCEYKVFSVNDDRSTNDLFHEQSYENNTMEDPSEVEEPTIFEDAIEAYTTTTSLVNDKALESITSDENVCSQDEIMRITDDPVNHPNALDDAEIELKSHVPYIKFVDVNDENRFSLVIFVDMAAEKEDRLLQKEKSEVPGLNCEETKREDIGDHWELSSNPPISKRIQQPPSGLLIAARRHMYKVLGFLGRNRLAAHSQPPGDARGFYQFPGFWMKGLAVLIKKPCDMSDRVGTIRIIDFMYVKFRENWENNWTLVGAMQKSGISRIDALPGGAGLVVRR